MGRLTRHARMQPCTVRVPSCCNFNPETTVFAHAPSISKGMGKKSEDWWGAFACSACHDILDSRAKHDFTKDQIAGFWLRAIHETQVIFFRDGLLIIS